MKMQDKWTFNSERDGHWNHDDFETKEEAIEAAREYLDNEQTEMYIGQCDVVPLPNYVDVDDIFERLNDLYADECFECEDDLFEDVKKEDCEWLEGEFKKLMNKFYERTGIKSTSYVIRKVEKITE